MVSLAALWLPIVLSSVIVFVVSALVWMVLPHHKSDWLELPDEEATMALLRGQGVTPGMYTLPYAASGAAQKDESFQAKVAAGPVAFLNVRPASTVTNMGPQLTMVFVAYLVVAFFVAYVGTATLPAGTEYLKVMQVLGTVAFLAHGGGYVNHQIWFGASWGFTWKSVADSLLYGLLIGGTFGAFWP